MPPILEIKNIHKSYGKIKAVRGASFQVQKGQCFGLLGPNGAGKSTTIEIIEKIVTPDEGEVLYKGERADHHFLKELGVQFQQTALPLNLTVKEAILTFQAFYPSKISLDKLIELCQLAPFLNQRHSQISGGQRQRLLLAIALCSDPQVLLLDEPTTGLDPQARRHLWKIVEDIKKQGKTVLLTTHYMDEAFQLCDEIGIMDHGVIIARGTPSNLLTEHFKMEVVRLPHNGIEKLDLQSKGDVFKKEGIWEIQTEDITGLIKELVEKNYNFNGMTVRQSNLEDLFLKLTGKELRE